MSCLKCGRDIEEGQVFCTGCREVMEKYPVKPGIAIQLPLRKDAPVPKKSVPKRRQSIAPDEQIRRLKKRVRLLLSLLLITLILLAATIYPTVEYFLGNRLLLPGQNYTTITSTESTEP